MKTKTKKSEKKSLVKRVISKITSPKTPEQLEAKKCVKFAKQKGIKTPFFAVDNLVRRTSDGKRYLSPEELIADGSTPDYSNVDFTHTYISLNN